MQFVPPVTMAPAARLGVGALEKLCVIQLQVHVNAIQVTLVLVAGKVMAFSFVLLRDFMFCDLIECDLGFYGLDCLLRYT